VRRLSVLAALFVAIGVMLHLPVAEAGNGNGGGNGGGKPSTTTTSSTSSTTTTSTSTTTSTTVPTGGGDPFQAEQWGLAKVEAPAAWSTATGRGVVVAVVDSGVDKDHPELRNKLVNGASWVDCGPRVQTPCTDSSAWDDKNGHGTHVAGIIAAPLDGVGVVGVAPDASIMPVRVLDAEGSGGSDDVAAGIRYAADHGADVINLSLGGLPVVSQLLDATGLDDFNAAVEYAIGQGVLVAIAAGNETAPLCDDDSLIRENGVCVGATNSLDVISYYSNFGVGLDVVAPGGFGSVFCDDPEDILSTYAISEDTVCPDRVGYETLAGTSMAAPHVSGVGALLAELGITGAAAAQRIANTCDDLGTPGYDPVFGYGRVNALRAVTGA
jgi:serine protease